MNGRASAARAAVAVAALAATLLLVAGCGSRSASPPTTTTTGTTTAATTTMPPATTTAPSTTAPAPGSVPTGFDPASFTAVSRDEFWLLGTAPCTGGSCAAILHTTDGGARFDSVPAPPGHSVDTLRFATSDEGFAFDRQSFAGPAGAGAAIWQTTDDGRHWTRLPFSDVRGFATGGGRLYLLRARCGTNGCDGMTLDARPLGGGAWSRTALPVGAVDPIASVTVHGSSLWISVSEQSGTHSFQTLLHSTDGGSTFTTGQSPCTNGLGGDLEASSAAVVWSVCPTGMLAGAARSTDGGVTWKPLDPGRELANHAQVAPADDSAAVLATGEQSELLRTTDGGATFSRVYPVRAGSWSFVGFTDAETGTGLLQRGGRTTVLRSTDAGATWHPLVLG